MQLTDVVALLALVAMEIVLGIDNIVFISVVTSRLPEAQQRQARNIGLALAMIMRVLLLLTITWIIQLKEPILTLTDLGFPEGWLPTGHRDAEGRTDRDLRLSEADVAADDAVHGLLVFEIAEHLFDRARLVCGLVEREGRLELREAAIGRRQGRALARRTRRVEPQ